MLSFNGEGSSGYQVCPSAGKRSPMCPLLILVLISRTWAVFWLLGLQHINPVAMQLLLENSLWLRVSKPTMSGYLEKEGRWGPWFANYKLSPWLQVTELSSHDVLPAAFRQLWLPLIIFQLLVFAGERKACIRACAGMCEAREDYETGEGGKLKGQLIVSIGQP